MSGGALVRIPGRMGGPKIEPGVNPQTSGANASNTLSLPAAAAGNTARTGMRLHLLSIIVFASAAGSATIQVFDSGTVRLNLGTWTLGVQAVRIPLDFFGSQMLLGTTTGQIDVQVGPAGVSVTTTLSLEYEYVEADGNS